MIRVRPTAPPDPAAVRLLERGRVRGHRPGRHAARLARAAVHPAVPLRRDLATDYVSATRPRRALFRPQLRLPGPFRPGDRYLESSLRCAAPAPVRRDDD